MNLKLGSDSGPWILPALVVLLLMSGLAWGSNAPIYKCFDKNLNLVYTDLPCKDGEELDLRPGDADPAAVARLERARDQLDQSAAQRILDERHAAIQRDLARQMAGPVGYEPVIPESLADGYGYAYPLASYPRYPHRRSLRHRQALVEPPRFAPSPPYRVPRR